MNVAKPAPVATDPNRFAAAGGDIAFESLVNWKSGRYPCRVASVRPAGAGFAATVPQLNVMSDTPAVMLRPAVSKRIPGLMLTPVSTLAANYLKSP